MRLPAESGRPGVRRWLEGVAHALALGLLAWLLADSLRAPGPGPAESVRTADLAASLRRWSTVAPPSRIHLTIEGAPTPAAIDWLAALARSGAPASWGAGDATPVAAVADPVADPAGGTRIRAAARAGEVITLADAFGALDSVSAGRTGTTFLARSGPQWVSGRAGVLTASTAVTDSLVLGRILVLGAVGWESKFVAAALEERGWRVDARLALSPRGNVVQGAAQPIDTARYSAVVVLDSSAPGNLAAIAPYLRSGGGVILTAAATRAPGLRGLGASSPAATIPAVDPFDTTAAQPRRSLGLVPVAVLPEQVVVERRGGQVAIAARRIERGRLLIVGYQDTWRWRMAGGGDAVEAHRAWWADLVSAVAHVGRVPRPPSAGGVDEAPYAHLVERFGPATVGDAVTATASRFSKPALFAILAGLLVLGWASRRLRGAA